MKEMIFFSCLMIAAGFLIRFKLKVYLTIILMGISTAIFYRLSIFDLFPVYKNTLFSKDLIQLIINIYFIFLFGRLLNVSGELDKIGNALLTLFSPRVAITILPMIIGFFPMPGGALFTVKFVEKIGRKSKFSDEVLSFTNFWFRHVWEFVYPVYPGFILYCSLLNIEPGTLTLRQFPLTLAMIMIGFIVLFYISRKQKTISKIKWDLFNIFTFLKKMWFVFLIFFVIFIDIPGTDIRLPVYIGLILSSIILITKNKTSLKEILTSTKKALNWNIFFTIVAVFLFQSTIELTPLSESVKNLVSGDNKQLLPIFTVGFPFVIGYLTGITTSFVGICFPVLISFLKADPNLAVIVYTSGFMGVLITPVHLCLSMTCEYLNADLSKVIKYLVPCILFVEILALVLYL
ncbi:MAG: hypothetical protein C0601_12095 [Candidatus Muiribacterium halophilum]|uniref:DUF401 domain-containing protein n=1 Tax=Muiribacterium halophilum TaxID=2053465 RepID=A0A2N5ZAW5_MUIH1|nr:MAG: hypothetical protein C0601_12095 [Candidatus Muirbacterium halophilum]